MIDAEGGPAEQDTKIASIALERGRSVVIALNKIDLLDAEGRKTAIGLARDTLLGLEVAEVNRSDRCSYRDESLFFYYRRNATTGRMASLIWIEASA